MYTVEKEITSIVKNKKKIYERMVYEKVLITS